jgi:hypothetical protein
MTNDNKYIPTVISLPRKEPIYERDFHEKPKPMLKSADPTRSTYQEGYEKPKTSMNNYIEKGLCRAAALQTLMRRDKFFAAKFDKSRNVSMSALEKRRNEIDNILIRS